MEGIRPNPQTLGDKVRNRRVQSHLYQKDVATFLGVSEDTVTYWENNRSQPQLNHYPKVIEFLGYFPFEIETSTLGGQIIEYRYRKGLNRKKLGHLLNVDVTTIRGWERNVHSPLPNSMEVLKALFLSVKKKDA